MFTIRVGPILKEGLAMVKRMSNNNNTRCCKAHVVQHVRYAGYEEDARNEEEDGLEFLLVFLIGALLLHLAYGDDLSAKLPTRE